MAIVENDNDNDNDAATLLFDDCRWSQKPPYKERQRSHLGRRGCSAKCDAGAAGCLTLPPGSKVTGKVCLHMYNTSNTRAHTRYNTLKTKNTCATTANPAKDDRKYGGRGEGEAALGRRNAQRPPKGHPESTQTPRDPLRPTSRAAVF